MSVSRSFLRSSKRGQQKVGNELTALGKQRGCHNLLTSRTIISLFTSSALQIPFCRAFAAACLPVSFLYARPLCSLDPRRVRIIHPRHTYTCHPVCQQPTVVEFSMEVYLRRILGYTYALYAGEFFWRTYIPNYIAVT